MSDESIADRDARIKKLWARLDTAGEGQIDIKGLKKGLKKIDHPLKNADDLLHDVLKAVDTSGDGQIQFNEFRVFVEHAERELWQLFESIDRDHSGGLDKEELRTAFKRSGLTISSSKLDQFFDEVDTNHDGEISFDEWRSALHTLSMKQILIMRQEFPPFHTSRHSESACCVDVLHCDRQRECRGRCSHQ